MPKTTEIMIEAESVAVHTTILRQFCKSIGDQQRVSHQFIALIEAFACEVQDKGISAKTSCQDFLPILAANIFQAKCLDGTEPSFPKIDGVIVVLIGGI